MSCATIVYADAYGETWNYGYTGWSAYSHYKHDYNKHGAKVVHSNNEVAGVSNANPGAWAKASVGTVWDPATFYDNPTVFYR